MSGLPASFLVTIDVLSDWHVGTGEGRLGVVDAVVRRDGDGLPFVPAKTLTGLWRDGVETVAATLDGGSPGPWSAWTEWIFGSQPDRAGDATASRGLPPRPAVLAVGPARYPSWLRQAVHDKPALQEAAVLLRPAVSLDSRPELRSEIGPGPQRFETFGTGTALEDFLRLEERALCGSTLTAEVDLLGDAQSWPAAAELLLRAGARFVEGIGGKRNRGAGRARLRLPGVEAERPPAPGSHGAHAATAGVPVAAAHAEAAADARLSGLLADGDLRRDPGRPPVPPALPAAHPVARQAEQAQVLRVTLLTLTPVVVPDAVTGNVTVSRPEIPGTLLLPQLLARIERSGPVGLGDVRAGDIVPAVEVPGGARPAWPTPLVWQRSAKGRGSDLYNAALFGPPPSARARTAGGRVARRDDGTWQQAAAGVAVATHAVVDDVQRRPTSSGGGVFTVTGIPAGTLLTTDVVIPADARLQLSVGERLRFGRSAKDDFGRVEVRDVQTLAAPGAEHSDGVGVLRIWCVSDVLVRDERLAPDPSPGRLATVVGAQLGVRLQVRAEADDATRATSVACARRDGFARRWGRLRPGLVGLRAGSVVTCTYDGDLDPAAVARIERDGVGERVAEGFGQIRLNPPELITPRPVVHAAPVGAETVDPPADHPSGDSAASGRKPSDPRPADRELPGERLSREDLEAELAGGAHPWELSAWRRQIRRRAAGAALNPPGVIPGISGPGQAQLGALRGQLERLGLPGGEQMVRAWFTSTARVSARRQQWGGALEQARALVLEDRARVWSVLGLAGVQPELVLADGREDLLREQLRSEAVAVLVAAVVRQVRAGREQPTPAGDEDTTLNEVGQS